MTPKLWIPLSAVAVLLAACGPREENDTYEPAPVTPGTTDSASGSSSGAAGDTTSPSTAPGTTPGSEAAPPVDTPPADTPPASPPPPQQ